MNLVASSVAAGGEMLAEVIETEGSGFDSWCREITLEPWSGKRYMNLWDRRCF